jgi:ATP-binding cassette, subfamily B, multidrug efflux pump
MLGLFFVAVSGKFAVMPGNVINSIISDVQNIVLQGNNNKSGWQGYLFSLEVFYKLLIGGVTILGLALMRGFFMFIMRQTIIVMSRHIEYDQKKEIYEHYQKLDTKFFKSHFTGDLMNRISEDVARVRMYTGPAIMYFSSMLSLAILCIWDMLQVNVILTLCVIAPLPFLAIAIYIVNQLIFKKSAAIQTQLSTLTTSAQESYSGIRVIKSFVQEKNILRFFDIASEKYRQSAINLTMTEAVFYPAMTFFIGLSMLGTILVGGYLAIHGAVTVGNIAQFVFYINLLVFPFSSIGLIASMTQRAGASQKRIDEFLNTQPEITSPIPENRDKTVQKALIKGDVIFDRVNFVYSNTGIQALKNFDLRVAKGQKVAIIGKTGSGKSTLSHLLLRMYDPTSGSVLIDGQPVNRYHLTDLREQIAYAPQEPYLFSDTVLNNIKFGKANATLEQVIAAATMADLDKDIRQLSNGYETMIGERGVMLSGGQKQRMILARAILKNAPILILDECLSAVDTQTEKNILNNLQEYLVGKTTFVITHRIFTSWRFDQILILEDGEIIERGTHDELIALDEKYAKLYTHQTTLD